MRKIIIIFLIFTSCINPYNFHQDDAPAYIVVEGYVSNNIGDSEICLSRSGTFQDKDFDCVPDAEVMVIENEEVEHLYAHQDNGVYKPLEENFFARKENSYRMRIELEGQIYESDPVKLENSLEIEDLSFKSASFDQSGNLVEHPRLMLHLTSGIDENASQYYLFTLEETWLARAIFPRQNEIKPIFTYDENNVPVYIEFESKPLENVAYCWPTNKAVGINTRTTEGLSRNQLVDVPVFSVSLESDKLLYKYSALVNQYAISQEAHHFFSMLKEFSQNTGILYDIQPGYISGNIHNKSNPEDQIIGIFYAASHTSSRIFISNDDLSAWEQAVVARYWPKCIYEYYTLPLISPDSLPDESLTYGLLYLRDSLLWGQGLMIRSKENRLPAMSDDSVIVLDLTKIHCMDCRVYGSNIKPDWWGSIE